MPPGPQYTRPGDAAPWLQRASHAKYSNRSYDVVSSSLRHIARGRPAKCRTERAQARFQNQVTLRPRRRCRARPWCWRNPRRRRRSRRRSSCSCRSNCSCSCSRSCRCRCRRRSRCWCWPYRRRRLRVGEGVAGGAVAAIEPHAEDVTHAAAAGSQAVVVADEGGGLGLDVGDDVVTGGVIDVEPGCALVIGVGLIPLAEEVVDVVAAVVPADPDLAVG